jgi:hypothetical protein
VSVAATQSVISLVYGYSSIASHSAGLSNPGVDTVARLLIGKSCFPREPPPHSLKDEVDMSNKHIALTARSARNPEVGLLLATGLAFASLILVPAVAAQIGLGSSLTGALRMALMKASNRAIKG